MSVNFTKNKVIYFILLSHLTIYGSDDVCRVSNAHSFFKKIKVQNLDQMKSFVSYEMQRYTPIIDEDGHKVVNEYWLYVVHLSLLHGFNDVSSVVLDYFSRIISSENNQLAFNRSMSVASFFSYGHEITDFPFDVNFGYLLHTPFDYSFTHVPEGSFRLKYNISSENEKKIVERRNQRRLFHFKKFLEFYKKHRIEEHLDSSHKGSTGLPLDSSKLTPLQCAWMQDCLRINYDYRGRYKGIKFFESDDDLRKSLTFQIVGILKDYGISSRSIFIELRKDDSFSRNSEISKDSSHSFNQRMTKEGNLADLIKARLGIKVTHV